MIGRLIATMLALTLTACSSHVSERISPQTAAEKIKDGALVLDVRTYEEYGSGHVENAINIPHTEIEQKLTEVGADKDREIVVYCASGRRAGIAKKALEDHGYTRVYNAGGYSDLAELDLSR